MGKKKMKNSSEKIWRGMKKSVLLHSLNENKGVWQTCQPGEEYYENDELHPVTPTDGFELKAGKNTIDINDITAINK